MHAASDQPLPFGALLRKYRLAASLTQEQLAQKALVSARAISDLERGVNRAARPDTLRQLVEALDLPPADRAILRETALRSQRRREEPPHTSYAESTIHAFLFVDLRGYTSFTAENGDEVAARLVAKFVALVRETVGARGGDLLELRGDEALVVFTSPRQAIRAAVELQQRFMDETQRDPALPLRAGIGLDVGEAVAVEGGYRSGALNLAARLCSLAGPGEVFASEVLTHLARKLDTIAFLDRGRVQLKGLSDPVRVIQAVAEGAPLPEASIFTSHATPTTNLPPSLTPFVGRERELRDIRGLLRQRDVRLVTLTGPGGTGKTRLAVQVAEELAAAFQDGVAFVPLAPVNDRELVASTINGNLGLRETAGRAPLDALKDHLRHKEMLLVLDNFEHLLGAAPLMAELLGACPRLRMLVTSRAVLHVMAEHLYAVPPLALPDRGRAVNVEALLGYDAVALFVSRARAARADFEVTAENAETIVEICHRLDGLPLALELAAAWSRLLSPRAMLERLDHTLQLLIGGSHDQPSRQHTLRSAIDWSYDLLDADERALFTRLAVFVGGFALDAVGSVCQADDDGELALLARVTSLVDKSLVLPAADESGDARFFLLETVREYALERFVAGQEVESLRRKHALFFLTLAQQAEPEMSGPEEGRWLTRFEADHDNIRAALTWCLQSGEGALGLTLGNALWRFWQARGHLAEGYRWFQTLLRVAGEQPSSEALRARALMLAAAFATNQGDYKQAHPQAEESLSLYRRLGDQQGLASALNVLGNIAHFQGSYRGAAELFTESLALQRKVGSERDVALALNNVASAVGQLGDLEHAARLYGESLAIQRSLEDRGGIASVLRNLGEIAILRGRLDEAISSFEDSLALYRELGDVVGTARSLNSLGFVARQQGEYERATQLFTEALRLGMEAGDKRGCADSLERLGGVVYLRARPDLAGRLFGAAAAIRDAIGSAISPTMRSVHEADVAATRSSLGKDDFAAVWATGRGLSLEQIVNELRSWK